MARGKYTKTVVDSAGDIQASATLTVTESLTAATATLYDARTGGSTITNPVTCDANGKGEFFVEPGVYTIVATAGAYTYTEANIAIGEAHERPVGVAAGTDIPDRDGADSRYLQISNDLSDVTAATARTNLGLGTLATQAEGTGAGDFRDNTANDARFLLESNNLSDLDTPATARSNLALGSSDNVTFNSVNFGDDNLDAYENSANTWTPVLTFATPGDLSVAYNSQTGYYQRVGDCLKIWFSVSTTTFTHTTASGNLLITGIPETSGSVPVRGTMDVGGFNVTGFNLVPAVGSSSTQIKIKLNAMGSAAANIVAPDTPSGTNLTLTGFVEIPL